MRPRSSAATRSCRRLDDRQDDGLDCFGHAVSCGLSVSSGPTVELAVAGIHRAEAPGDRSITLGARVAPLTGDQSDATSAGESLPGRSRRGSPRRCSPGPFGRRGGRRRCMGRSPSLAGADHRPGGAGTEPERRLASPDSAMGVGWFGPATVSPDPAGPGSFLGGKAGDEREVVGVRLCWCPPGRIRKGSPPDEPGRRPDEDPVEVTLTRGFWMGK